MISRKRARRYIATFVALALAAGGLSVEASASPLGGENAAAEEAASAPDPGAANEAAKRQAEKIGHETYTRRSTPLQVGPNPPGNPTVGERAEIGLDSPGEPVVESGPVTSVPGTVTSERQAVRAPAEMVLKRTERSRTIDNGDGTYTTEVSQTPIHFLRNGLWAQINTELKQGADGRWDATATPTGVEFGANASGSRLAQLTLKEGGTLSYGLSGAAAVGPEISGSTATYRGVMPDVDIELSALATGVKETLVLQSREAPDRFVFPLELGDLKAKVESTSGDVVFVDAGDEVARIPKGWMVDSGHDAETGEQRISLDVNYAVVDYGAGKALEVKLNRAWLDAPERVWPVRVDPTVNNAPPLTDDTYLDSCVSGNNSSQTILRVGGGTCQRAAFIKFDMSFFTNKSVMAASLFSYNSHSQSCTSYPVYVYQVTQAWNGATMLSYPGASIANSWTASESFSYGSTCTGGNWAGWDITPLARGWARGTISNYGVSLRAAQGSTPDPNTYKEFSSANAAGNGQYISVLWSGNLASYQVAPAWTVNPQYNRRGRINVTLTNNGTTTWNNSGTNPYRLGYHLSGSDTVWEGRRTDLPSSVAPGQSVVVAAEIDTVAPGSYLIDWDVIQENVTWFSQEGNDTARIGLNYQNIAPVIYSAGPGGPINTLTPTLSAKAVNPDWWPTTSVSYDYKICADKEMQTGCETSGSTGISWPVPASFLRWKKTYWWTVTASEASGGTSTSLPSAISLTTEVPQPVTERHFGFDAFGGDNGGVNPSVRNYVRSFTDAKTGGAGIPLELTRTYNSLDSRVGMFGTGWSNQFDMRLVDQAAAGVRVYWADGRQEQFGRNPDLTYASGPGQESTLSGAPVIGWTLRTKDATAYVFDGSGKLTGITNPLGQSLTLAYGGGDLATVTNSVNNRRLYFTWTSTSPKKVATVATDAVSANGSQPYTWTYTYTGDTLTKVCNPISTTACTGFTYGTTGGANGKLTKITLPKGNTYVELGYSSGGLVTWRKDGAGKQWNYSDTRDARSGYFHPLAPTNVHSGSEAPFSETTLNIDVVPGINFPDIKAVVLNVVATGVTSSGYLTFYDANSSEPPISQVLLNAGEPSNAQITVPLDFSPAVYAKVNTTASVDFTVEVVGWYSQAGVSGGTTYHPVAGGRILDTRPGSQVGPYSTPGLPNGDRFATVTGVQGVPTTGVEAVVLHIITLDATDPADWTIGNGWSRARRRILPGAVQSSMMIVPVGTTPNPGDVLFGHTAGTLNVIIDIVGWYGSRATYPDDAVFEGVSQFRLLDSRGAAHVGPFETPWAPSENRGFTVAGQGGIPAGNNLVAVAGSIVSPGPANDAVVVGWDGQGSQAPVMTTLFGRAGRVVSTGAILPIDSGGKSYLQYGSAAAGDLIVDVAGYFYKPIDIVSVQDPRGNWQYMAYDSRGRLVGSTDATGKTRSFTYDDNGYVRDVTDETGAKTTLSHDEHGNVIQQEVRRDGQPVKTYYEYYSAAGTDPRANKLVATRDGRSSDSSDNTYRTSYALNADGSLASVTEPPTPEALTGAVTTYAYTTGSEVAAAGAGTMPAGLLRTVTDARSHTITYGYDAKGDVRVVTDRAGLVSTFIYDELGRRISSTEISANAFPSPGITRTATFDGLGRVLTVTDPPVTNAVTSAVHQLKTTAVYDDNGNLVEERQDDIVGSDPDRVTLNHYDAADRLDWVKDAELRTTTFTYDDVGNLATTTDPAGNVIRNTYTARNQLATSTLENFVDDPIAPSSPRNVLLASRAYDQVGRLTSSTDALGRTKSWTFYEDGTLASEVLSNFDDPDGATRAIPVASYSYDGAGNLIRSATVSGQVDASDNFNRANSASTLGAPWTATVGTWGIASNNAYLAGASGTGNMALRDATADTVVRAKLSGVGDGAGIVVRAADGANHWRVKADSVAGNWKLIKTVAGVETVVATSAPSTCCTAGQKVEIHAANSSISVYVDGVLLLSTRDAFGATNTKVGLTATAVNAARFDDFSATRLAVTTLTYDAASQVRDTVFDPAGLARHSEMLYDVNGNLTQVKRNKVGDLSRVEQTNFTYDAGDQLLSQAVLNNGAQQLITAWTRDERGDVKTMTTARGSTYGFVSDEYGRTVRVTMPTVAVEENGAVPVSLQPYVETGFNTFGDATHSRDARGAVTSTTVDKLGRTVTQTLPAYTPPGGSPLTATTSLTYDASGAIHTVTDRRGNTTTIDNDTLGRPVQVTGPAVAGGSPVAKSKYDDAGRTIETTDPVGARVLTTYDDLNRVRTHTTVERYPSTTNLVWSLGYDDAGGLTTETSPAGVTVSNVYNAAGEVTRTDDPAVGPVTYGYDLGGRMVAATDAAGSTDSVIFDLAGRPTTQERRDPISTLLETRSWTYDEDGNTTGYTDPAGKTTTSTFDAVGNLTARATPVSAGHWVTESYGYDKAGNATRYSDGRQTNPNDHTYDVVTTYNVWGLVESLIEPSTPDYPNPADRTETTSYDAGGLPVKLELPGGVVRNRTFDALGRLTSETGTGAEAATTTRTLGYDRAGRLTSASAPAGTIGVTYNDRGLPLSVTGGASTASYSYTADGSLSSRTDAAGATSFAYDTAGRLATALDPLTGATATYGYDSLGRVSTVGYGSNTTRTYTYDGLSRLNTDVLKTGTTTLSTVTYGYDPNSNVTSKEVGPAGVAGVGTNSYSYDWANRLESWTAPASTPTSYTWDDASNRIDAGGTSFTYDARNRLTSQTDGSGTTDYDYTARGTLLSTDPPVGATTSLAFDAFDRLVTDGAVSYTYDALDRVAQRGATTFSYAGLAKDVVDDGAFTYSYGADGSVLGADNGAAASLASVDSHGDLAGTFSAGASAMATSRAFDPWGVQTAAVGSPTSLGFQSDWTDPTTGRVDMHARFYTPGTATFASRDWYDDPAAMNRYGYPTSPISSWDPTGHECHWLKRGLNNILPGDPAGKQDCSHHGPGAGKKKVVEEMPPELHLPDSANGGTISGEDGQTDAPEAKPPARKNNKNRGTKGRNGNGSGGGGGGRAKVDPNNPGKSGKSPVPTTPGPAAPLPPTNPNVSKPVDQGTPKPGPAPSQSTAGVVVTSAAAAAASDENWSGPPRTINMDLIEVVKIGIPDPPSFWDKVWNFGVKAIGLKDVLDCIDDPDIGSCIMGTLAVVGWLGVVTKAARLVQAISATGKLDAVAAAGGLWDEAAALHEIPAPRAVDAAGDLARVPDFADDAAAFRHYAKHAKGIELGPKGRYRLKPGGADLPEFSSFGQYRDAARSFMGGGVQDGVIDAYRLRDNALIRVDPKSGYFGVRDAGGTIRTFFRPDGDPVQYFWNDFLRMP